jgi:hypothetical protein
MDADAEHSLQVAEILTITRKLAVRITEITALKHGMNSRKTQ